MIIALACAPAIAASANSPCANEDLIPTTGNLDRVESALLCVMNRERVAEGLVPLWRSTHLDRSARFHTLHMVRAGYLGHEAASHPSTLARIRAFGYFTGSRGGLYGENIGAGPGISGTPRALVRAWMASDGHRVNVMYGPFRDVGISALMVGPHPAFFEDLPSAVYTTDFGRRYVRQRCARRRSRPSQRVTAPRRRYCA